MTRSIVIIVLLTHLFIGGLHGQSITEKQTITILPSSDTLYINFIEVNKVIRIYKNGVELNSSTYKIDYVKKIISFKESHLDSLRIEQSDLPKFLSSTYFHKDINSIKLTENPILNPFAFNPTDSRADLISLGTLTKSGSISRGLTLGNSQDLGINSSLNLQLSGKLSDDVEIIAAISDDNIPIQPEGNTQQIQDFDRVYIQLINNKNILTAGDFELKKPNSYFLNYYKKVKGVSAFTEQKISKQSSIKAGASIAVAKGKYARLSIQGIEGNQGPYRLKGNNNENYIIVLAGTERIYIDGELLKRGENLDYTIDYNSAELIFTTRRPINTYTRIIAEYEYSDKNYARSLTIINSEYQSTKWNFRFNYYNEQDSKNKPLLQTLDNDQKLLLSQIGDNLSSALYSAVDSQGFNANQIRYKQIDSSGYTVYVYSNNEDSAFYQLSFTELGNQLGNYIQINSVANGRVFQWIQPINGIPQGNFEPVVLLVTPKKTEEITYAMDYKISSNWEFNYEGAITNNDLNLYSKVDDRDNFGFAHKAGVINRINLKSDSANKLILKSQVSVELTDRNFKPIEFYRPVEFYRDYNIASTLNTKSNEVWVNANAGIEKNGIKLIDYRLSLFTRDTLFNGIQQQTNTNLSFYNFRLIGNVSLLNSEFKTNNSTAIYLKHKFDFSKSFSWITIGLIEETENNQFKNSFIDTLAFSSFSFRDYRVYLQNNAEAINKYKIEYSNRLDKRPYQNELRSSTLTENINFLAELNSNSNSLWSVGINYRKLAILSSISNLKSEENLLTRIKHDGNFLKGFINTSTYYEIGSGQEPKREFSFIQVPIGQGVYVYNDYNGNGIKELNEFEIAKYSYEADYIRINTLSNQFVQTKSTIFSESIMIDPSRKLIVNNTLKKIIVLFSNQALLKIDKKVLNSKAADIWNPFDVSIVDSSLISLNTSFRNTIYFNRTNPIFGLEYSFQQNSNKALLSNGFDRRQRFENLLRSRSTILGNYSFNTEYKFGDKEYSSEFLTDKNYLIKFWEFKPELGYQINSTIKVLLSYVIAIQNNSIGLKEKAVRNLFSLEARYNSSGSSNLSGKINFIQNKYNSISNTSIAYEMLEALQVGNNYTWNLTYQRNFGSNFQVNVIYDGRSSANSPTIHAGSVQARAFF